jgi:hypothetical protein
VKTRRQSQLRLAASPGLARRHAILSPWPGLGWVLVVGLLVLSPPLWAQVSAVDLAEWGQEKAAPRPAESAPGEITALDTGDEAAAETAKVAEIQPTKPRVAVYQFKVRGDLGIPDAGDIIGEWMIGALAATGRFTLMERVLLQKVFEENELQSSHLADESTVAAEAGRLYGVEAIVSGTAIKWGETISIEARLIDTGTGVIRATAGIKTNNRNNIPDQIDLLARKLVGPVPAPTKSKTQKQDEAGARLVAQNPARLAIQILPRERFRLGQEMRFRITSQQEGHLLVVDLNADGELTQVYPMDQGEVGAIDNRLRPGRALTLPEPHSGLSFTASEPTGTGRLVAILTEEAVDLGDLGDGERLAGAGQDPVGGILDRLSQLQAKSPSAASWSMTQAEYLIEP